MLIGYARISTPDQSLDPHLEALRAAGVEQPQLYTDIASGARTERRGLQEALAYAREGDTLVVWKLDRLGRSLGHLIEVMNDLEQRGVGFKSLTEGFDTTTPRGKLGLPSLPDEAISWESMYGDGRWALLNYEWYRHLKS